MEKEIDIDRGKIVTYNTWTGFIASILLIPFGIGLPLLVIHVILVAVFYQRQAEAIRYYYDSRALRVERGLLFKSRKTIPFDKITDLELVQGPLLRALGMWNIKVQTASTASQMPEATLMGVVNPEQVREEILVAKDEYLKAHGAVGR